MSTDTPLVLVVEDEDDLADLYATWLSDAYRVRIARGGEDALRRIDDAVDVVLLDRRMPDVSGDEVLEFIRERDFDCTVAMVTAAEPDFDVVDMGFDDYVVKPVSRDELLGTVSSLLLRADYDDGIQDLFSLASKMALLEAEKSPRTLDESDEYLRLEDELERRREELDQTLFDLGDRLDASVLYGRLGDTRH